jgi:hypothetical protein
VGLRALTGQRHKESVEQWKRWLAENPIAPKPTAAENSPSAASP